MKTGVKLMWKSNRLLTYKKLVRLQLHQNATPRYSSLCAAVCLSINNFLDIIFVNRVRYFAKITTAAGVAGTCRVIKGGGRSNNRVEICSTSCNF